MKIASICPSNTEMLHYLGLSHFIVGVDDYSDWPDLSCERLGPDLSIHMDKLAALEPDLVIASLSVPGMEKNIAALEERGLRHLVLNPQSLADIAADLQTLLAAIPHDEEAKRRALLFTETITAIQRWASTVETRPSIYFEWWPKPIFTPGQVNWLTEVSDYAGGRNVFADVELASVQTTWQDVVSRNPDVIAMCWVGVKENKMKIDHVLQREAATQVSAVQQNAVYKLKEALYCRPSPLLLIGLVQLAERLHPERANELRELPFYRLMDEL